MSFRNSLIRAASGSALMKVCYMALTLAGSVVLARALGPEGYGIYALALAVVNVIAIPAQAGVPTLLVRETAKAHSQENWAGIKGLWRWSSRLIVTVSVVILSLSLIGLWAVSSKIGTAMLGTVAIALMLVPLIALGDARGAALRGLRHIVLGQLPESIIRPGLLVVFTGSAWWLAGELTAPSAMAWHAMASFLAFAIGVALLLRKRPAQLVGVKPDVSSASQWRRAVLPLALISSVQLVGAQVGIVLLGVYQPEADVGLYKVAASAAGLALFGLQVSKLVAQPHIARLYISEDKVRLQRLCAAAAIVGTVLTVPAFLVFIVFGRSLLGLLYGDAYLGAWTPLIILTFGQVVSSVCGSVAPLLNMTGHERDSFKWMAIAVGLNILASMVLIPRMGMEGSALAYAGSMVFWNIAFRRIALLRTGIDGSVFGWSFRTRI